ncbi:MAG: hypothetical protein ABR518_00965 [Actinomycetota bacterium]
MRLAGPVEHIARPFDAASPSVGGLVGEVTDCTWCGSAGSIAHGMCQVCFMPYPDDNLDLPDPDDPSAPVERVVTIREDEQPPASAESA